MSDNYVAFVRIIKWYYHSLSVLQCEKDYVEPQSPVRMWLLPTCKELLKMYDITYKGKVRELRLKLLS